MAQDLVSRNKNSFRALVVSSLAILLLGLLFVVLVTRPHHLIFLGFMFIFSIFETARFTGRIRNHLPFTLLWPCVLSAFFLGLAVAMLVVWLELLVLPATISSFMFIILTLLMVFAADVTHTLTSLEFGKWLLRKKVGEDFEENLIIAHTIHPGRRSFESGLRSILFTGVLLFGLAVLMTLGVTKAVIPQFDSFASVSDEDLQVPEVNLPSALGGLTIVKETRDLQKEWAEDAIKERDVLIAKRRRISDSVLKDTWMMLKGELFPIVVDGQEFAMEINGKFSAAQMDYQAFQRSLDKAMLSASGKIQVADLDSLQEEVDAQYNLFKAHNVTDALDIPLGQVETPIGKIDIESLLPSEETTDLSVFGALYTKFFSKTAFYQNTHRILDNLKDGFEKEYIEHLHTSLNTKELEQSRYVRLQMFLYHLVKYNEAACGSLEGGEKVTCFKKAKLINQENCDLFEGEAAFKLCKSDGVS